MQRAPDEPLSLAALAEALAAVDRRVVLAPAPVLRRVIRHDCKLSGLALHVPHARSYTLATEALFRLVGRDELLLDPSRGLPDEVVLLVAPDPDELAEPAPALLGRYWRLLFHARVHLALEARWREGRLTLRDIQARVEALGPAAFSEASEVLRHEGYLLPPGDLRGRFGEFAAVLLELRQFARPLLRWYFPTLRDEEAALAALRDLIDPDALLAATRPAGAALPQVPLETASEEPQAYYRRLVREADQVGATGNVVRAAILASRATRVAVAELEEPTRRRALDELSRLVERLTAALRLEPACAAAWREVLPQLLDKADQGAWPQEARLLYDLQKACTEAEQEVYRVSLWSWWREGRLRVPVELQRELRVLAHLRTASRRLPAVRLYDRDRRALSELLRAAMAGCERRLEAALRPRLLEGIEASRLLPRDLPEQVARDKVVAELLDLVLQRGFLTFSDIRDVLARNQLKLEDLGGPGELALGDPMLRLNRRLSRSLDGVYRGGELYRRFLQRVSAVFSGTRWGRALVLYLLLPFGAAVGLETGAVHLAHTVQAWVAQARGVPAPTLAPATPGEPAGEPWLDAADLIAVGVLGVLVLLLLHAPPARALASQGLRALLLGARWVVLDLPRLVAESRAVRRLVRMPAFVAFRNYLFLPARITALLWVVWWLIGHPLRTSVPGNAAIFLGAALLVNTRQWARLEEGLSGTVFHSWRFFRFEFLQAAFGLVMSFFKGIGEAMEGLLYTVDERLRFRSGDSRLTTALKAALLPVWFPVSYLLRLSYDTFVEPRINPIKYFSVVMVADKLFLPLTPSLLGEFGRLFDPLGPVAARTLAWVGVYAVPAFAGFLVWELKENWRLYRANRTPGLAPVAIGARGETLPRLLQPGVGSLTLPELYGRLRQAERAAHRSGDWTASRKHRAALEALRGGIERFLERDFLALLRRSRAFAGAPLGLGELRTGLASLSLEVVHPRHERALRLAFEADSGWMRAQVEDPGWLEQATPAERDALRLALLGLYKSAGVALVAEQLARCLGRWPALQLSVDVVPEGLEVWPAEHYEAAALYDLEVAGPVEPEPLSAASPLELPTIDARELDYEHVHLARADWSAAWEAERDGRPIALLDALPFAVLPPRVAPAPALRADEGPVAVGP